MDNLTTSPQTSGLTNNNQPVRITQPSDIMLVRLDKRNTRYKAIPEAERHQWLKGQLMKLSLLAHQRPDPEVVPIEVAALDEMILQGIYTSDLTLPEMEWAFMRGLRGIYGEYFAIGAVSMIQFLDGYITSDEKRKATELVRLATGVEKPKSAGAVDYIKRVQEHNARVLAERMAEWKKEEEAKKKNDDDSEPVTV